MHSLRSVLVVVGVSCLPAAFFACSGDVFVSDGTDAGPDSASPDAGGDAAFSDVSPGEGGSKCNYPGAGVPGALDPSWQSGAHAEAQNPTAGDVDPSGNIYVATRAENCVSATSSTDIAIYKYLPTGLPDTSFGTGGRFCIDVNHDRDLAWSVRADPAGGSILVTGARGGVYMAAIVVARVKSNGVLDASFGNNGIFTGTVPTTMIPVAYGLAFDTSVTPARLIVVGSDGDPQNPPDHGGFVLRLTAGGQIDNGFHTGAPVTDTAAAGYYAAAADSAGNVFVTGASGVSSHDLIVRKLTVAGLPDTSFGIGGTATLAQLSNTMSEGRGVIALAGGHVIVAGMRTGKIGPELIARLTPKGTLDPSFAAGSATPGALFIPSVTFDSYDSFSMLSPRCDGQYLLSGYDGDGNGAFARVSTAGTLEPSFGTAGIAISSSKGVPLNAVEDSLTRRIVAITAAGNPVSALLERYNP